MTFKLPSDAYELIQSHPHSSIAAAASSTGATRGSLSTADLQSSAQSTATGEPEEADDDDFDDGDWDVGTTLPALSVLEDSSAGSHAEQPREDSSEDSRAEQPQEDHAEQPDEDHDDDHDDEIDEKKWESTWRSRRKRSTTWASHRDESYRKWTGS